ncbi:hypothetical protein BJ508DRAFT_329016 [Ascobolus immersus RN42]|uniref:Uncharacterized protein n=1 Tax=Ascobolus immersus RN42 TaxID=1160509 RepID=A0A3N4I1Z4_ASCIM|nr:hypothetical protein BJ508DRAFT_329016 [Ascobolus immersus RN42]
MSQEQHMFRTMSTSNTIAAALPSVLDEELPAEGDEPPEQHSGHSDSDFAKHTIKQTKPPQSLLTRGLVESQNPAPKRTSRLTFGTCSTSSYLSAASTADLTDDAGSTDVSRTSSPVFPTLILPNIDTFPGLIKSGRQSSVDSQGTGIQIIDNSTDDSMDSFQRRRRITFASDVKSPARQPFARCRPLSPAPQRRTSRPVSPAPLRRAGIKFALDEKPQHRTEFSPSTPRPSSPRKPSIRFACPNSDTATKKELDIPSAHKRSDSQSTITAVSPAIRFIATSQSIPEKKAECKLKKFYEFASSCSEDESWMDLTMEKKGLMKVDDIMKKERDIQKLSRECSDEFDDEEQEEDDDDEVDEDEDGEDDNDSEEDEDEDDDDEDDDEDEFSGNETDNEDGFASDSDGDNNSFFGSFAPPTTFFNNIGHVFKRRLSNDSDASGIAPEAMPVFAKTASASDMEQADLPDSTDFVCGTLDEDRPLEEAFKNKLEEAKKAEQGIYYIDPDFPASDNDDEDNDDDDEDEDEDDERLPAGRMSRSNSPAQRGRTIEFAAARRFHSPPPKAAGRVSRHISPPPPVRRNSRHLSPPPKPVRRNSRHLSPPPPKRRNSHDIHKTKSLPRTSSMHKAKKAGNKTNSAASSLRTEAVAIVRPRGAMDIVEGMRRRKERRKACLQRKEDGVAPGEGVEKMRQLGLCKAPANPQWIFSV